MVLVSVRCFVCSVLSMSIFQSHNGGVGRDGNRPPTLRLMGQLIANMTRYQACLASGTAAGIGFGASSPGGLTESEHLPSPGW